MVEGPPDLASETLGTLEDVAEPSPVDVERNLVRVACRTARLGRKEDEHHLAYSEGLCSPSSSSAPVSSR